MKKKTTKAALLSSLLAMVLCCTMLVGTTYAWFTDSVSSAGNIIKSGTLDLEMSYAETPSGTWTNVETLGAGAIFDYELWEPGYTQIRYVKVANVGNLALKYQMAISANGTVETTPEGKTLADVIDVYYAPVENAADLPEFNTRADFPGTLQKIDGSLASLLNDASGVNGVLLPVGETKTGCYSGEVYLVIGLHMQESAGNEYQNLSIGDGFTVKLLATQYTYEEDSFDEMYDDQSASVDLPAAAITRMDPATVGNNGDGLLRRYSNDTVVVNAEDALEFVTTETVAQIAEKDYKDWIVDFRLTFNQAVEAEKVYLFGNYAGYTWLGDLLSTSAKYNNADPVVDLTDGRTVAAGESILVMKDWFEGALATAGVTLNWQGTYYEVVNEVGAFQCALHVDGAPAGLVATLELIMTDPVTGNVFSVSTDTYAY